MRYKLFWWSFFIVSEALSYLVSYLVIWNQTLILICFITLTEINRQTKVSVRTKCYPKIVNFEHRLQKKTFHGHDTVIFICEELEIAVTAVQE